MRLRQIAILTALALTGSFAQAQQYSQFFASQVVRYSPGVGNSLFPDPLLAMGGPKGLGYNNGSMDVVTLGVQGELVLGFGPGQFIVNADGPDLAVFENPFGGPYARFAELVRVGVSSNGSDFAFFPVTCDIDSPVPAYMPIDSTLVSGFAGVGPVLANVQTNGISPFDPAVSGGDVFDLASLASQPPVLDGRVDLSHIRYVLLKDVLGNGTEQDSRGHVIYDPTGDMDPPYSNTTSADIDAIAVIHGGPFFLPGDANRDHKVDGADYTVWADNLGASPATWEQGNFDGNNVVDELDGQLWAQYYGQTSGGLGGQDVPVPCPPAAIMLLIGAAALKRKATSTT